MMPELAYRYLGRRRYAPVWDLQRAIHGELATGVDGARETFLAVEHEPVITVGRRGRAQDVLLGEAELAVRGIDLHQVERGGEVTYHGPGQLVLYPIVRVEPSRFGVVDLVRNLAGAIADQLAPLGITAEYDPEQPGLWVGASKIGAVGMRVARGVSMHGAALNVTVEPGAFGVIVPCGLPGAAITSVRRELGEGARVPALADLALTIAGRFAERLGFELRPSER